MTTIYAQMMGLSEDGVQSLFFFVSHALMLL